MVRNRNRTSTRQSWDDFAMAKAIKTVVNGQMGYRRASVAYDVPQTTLERRVRLYRENPDMELAIMKGLGRFETVFSTTQEKELVDYLQDMESRLHGLTVTELKILAWQLAEQNGIRHPFTDGMAGEGWMRGFLKRNSILSLRQPEATSAARARGFNKVVVNNFQTLLQQTIEKYNLTPNRIYNVDETGCSTVPKHVSKIIATKGKRQVGVVTSGERGQLVTVEMCVSASGRYLPPMFIFPRVRMVESMMTGAPEGSWGVCHPSGWMQTEIFFEWFKWFVEIVQPSKEEPVLLLLDGHTTHTRNLEVIDYAQEHYVVILCFPPHCTHKLQPLDVSVMRPLSIYYSAEVKQWMRVNAGRVVNPAQIPELFGRAYKKAASAQTAINGFRKVGIWPFNRDVFSDEDFMAAEVTNRRRPCLTEQMIHTNEWTPVVEPDWNRQDSSIDATAAVAEPDWNLQDSSIEATLANDIRSFEGISHCGMTQQSEPSSDCRFFSAEEFCHSHLSESAEQSSDAQFFSAEEFCNSHFNESVEQSSDGQFFSAEEDLRSQSRMSTRAHGTNPSQAHLDVCTPLTIDLSDNVHSDRGRRDASVETVFNDSILNFDDIHPTEAYLSSRKSLDRVNLFPRKICHSPSNLSMESSQLSISMPDEGRLRSLMIPPTEATVVDDLCANSSPKNLNVAAGADVFDDLSQSLSQVSIWNEEEIISDPQPHCSKTSPRKRPASSSFPSKQPRKSGVPFRAVRIFLSSEDEDAIVEVLEKPTTYCRRKSKFLATNEFTVSPYDIQPLPVTDEVQPRKRRARGKTAILTDSQYREQLFQQKQVDQHPTKTGKLQRKGPKRTGKVKEKGKNSRRPTVVSREDASSEDVACLFCEGLYSESTEGWIQCQTCKNWSHESCAGIDTDELVKYDCDFCKK